MKTVKSIIYPKITSKDVKAKVNACVETAYNKFMNRQDDINKWKELDRKADVQSNIKVLGVVISCATIPVIGIIYAMIMTALWDQTRYDAVNDTFISASDFWREVLVYGTPHFKATWICVAIAAVITIIGLIMFLISRHKLNVLCEARNALYDTFVEMFKSINSHIRESWIREDLFLGYYLRDKGLKKLHRELSDRKWKFFNTECDDDWSMYVTALERIEAIKTTGGELELVDLLDNCVSLKLTINGFDVKQIDIRYAFKNDSDATKFKRISDITANFANGILDLSYLDECVKPYTDFVVK